MTNPWRLSKNEARVIGAIIEHGTPKKTAAALRMTLDRVRLALNRVRRKMGVGSTLVAAVMWDRWARQSHDVRGKF